MKKTGTITLVLVTGLLGCHHPQKHTRLFLRTDTLDKYTPAGHNSGGYYVFRPFGSYYEEGYNSEGAHYGGSYVREGYSNAGVHSSESGISRGGFGRSGGFHASS